MTENVTAVEDIFGGDLPGAIERTINAENLVRKRKIQGLKLDHDGRYCIREGTTTLLVPPVYAGLFNAKLHWPEGAEEMDLREQILTDEDFQAHKPNRALNDMPALRIAGYRGDEKDVEYIAAMNCLIYMALPAPAFKYFYGKAPKKIVKKFEDLVAKEIQDIKGDHPALYKDKEYYFAVMMPILGMAAKEIHKDITGEEWRGGEEKTGEDIVELLYAQLPKEEATEEKLAELAEAINVLPEKGFWFDRPQLLYHPENVSVIARRTVPENDPTQASPWSVSYNRGGEEAEFPLPTGPGNTEAADKEE